MKYGEAGLDLDLTSGESLWAQVYVEKPSATDMDGGSVDLSITS